MKFKQRTLQDVPDKENKVWKWWEGVGVYIWYSCSTFSHTMSCRSCNTLEVAVCCGQSGVAELKGEDQGADALRWSEQKLFMNRSQLLSTWNANEFFALCPVLSFETRPASGSVSYLYSSMVGFIRFMLFRWSWDVCLFNCGLDRHKNLYSTTLSDTSNYFLCKYSVAILKL